MTLPNGQLTSKSGYLPDEVLSSIFRECLEGDELDCISPTPLQAPLALTWVCRHWRNISLNTHRLWQNVAFLRLPDRVADSTRLLELWIDRSGALPFGVRFDNLLTEEETFLSIMGESELRSERAKGIREFINTLLKCRKRWRILEVVLPDMSFAVPLLQAVTEDALRLEHFCVSFQYLGLNEGPLSYDFSRNTALQNLRLVSPRILPVPKEHIFSDLVLLELHFCASVQDCLMWLDMAPNLHTLVVRFFCTGQRLVQPDARHIRRLPYLHSLEVTCLVAAIQADDPSMLLNMLELPALTELEIEMFHSFDMPEEQYVRNLLVRSGASLLSLCLSGALVSEEEVIECLRLSPELNWLEVSSVTDNILTMLTPRLISAEGNALFSGSNPGLTQTSRVNMVPNPTVDGTGGHPQVVPVSEEQDSMQTESVTQSSGISDDSTDFQDPSNYTVMCPQLAYFETTDIDLCSLQKVYEMAVSRCEDVYQDIHEYVDLSLIRPTPTAFKTLESIVFPCDPLYDTLSHPEILEGMERNVYF